MRWIPQGRLRKCACCAVLLTLTIGGFLVYFIATSDSLRTGFRRLRPDLSRSQVETILGGPGSAVTEISVHISVPTFSNMGKLTGDGIEHIELSEPEWSRRSITAWNTWDGPEGFIVVGFDSQDRLVQAGFFPRVTWRYMVRNRLPWLK